VDKFFSIKVFQQIVSCGSFVLASEKLGISKAMTSNYLKHLENDLGVRLINRTSRRISLTNEGRIYYESCLGIINDLEETELSLKSSTVSPKGLLKVAIPIWFQFQYFTDGIKKYLEQNPRVTIDLSLNDRIVDLVEEGIDIALRATSEPHSHLIARRICKINFFLVGSKNYFQNQTKPKTPEDLSGQKFISHSAIKMKNGIPFIKSGGEIKNVEIPLIVSTNSTNMMAKLAVSGVGLALLPEFLINDPYFKKDLEIILPEYPIKMDIHLFSVYSSKRFLSPKVRTFIDFMVDWFKNL